METKDFKQALSVAYSNLNYEQFCEVIDEPTHYGHEYNAYALDKWNNFKTMCEGIARLGTILDKLIEFGLTPKS